MQSPLIPPNILAVVGMLVLAGCQPGSNPHPVPSVPQIGGDLKCSQGDHGYEDLQAGWGFCYPGTWKYNERSQTTVSPPGLDLTFDITCLTNCKVPCPTASAGSGSAQCSPQTGLFAYMIVSTYQRSGSADLANWVGANMKPAPDLETISWGNAQEAARLPDGRRIALTPHHVVILDVHTGVLDLETEMSSRLGTWKFSY